MLWNGAASADLLLWLLFITPLLVKTKAATNVFSQLSSRNQSARTYKEWLQILSFFLLAVMCVAVCAWCGGGVCLCVCGCLPPPPVCGEISF
jgi:hypothetical protein